MSGFRFQGSAFGVAGRITIPFQELIEVQAASVLPSIGGYSSARVANFRYRDLLSFEAAQTVVTGTQTTTGDNPVWGTLISSSIENFNLMGMVTADRIVTHIVSTQRGWPGRSETTLRGTHFENLKIAGMEVTADLAVEVLNLYPTHAALKSAYPGNENVQKLFHDDEVAAKAANAPDKLKPWLRRATPAGKEMPENNGVASFSLVKNLTMKSSGLELWGHAIYIEGFGTVRLAEVDITPFSRSLTMLQVTLGCPVGGSVGGGGSDW